MFIVDVDFVHKTKQKEHESSDSALRRAAHLHRLKFWLLVMMIVMRGFVIICLCSMLLATCCWLHRRTQVSHGMWCTRPNYWHQQACDNYATALPLSVGTEHWAHWVSIPQIFSSTLTSRCRAIFHSTILPQSVDYAPLVLMKLRWYFFNLIQWKLNDHLRSWWKNHVERESQPANGFYGMRFSV